VPSVFLLWGPVVLTKTHTRATGELPTSAVAEPAAIEAAKPLCWFRQSFSDHADTNGQTYSNVHW